MKVGLLDIPGRIEETVELAPLADSLGYARYWIAEHQPQPSPTLIATVVAGITERIRVGTGGILLHYYVPRRAAHDFHFLQRAYYGRIDAGFCAAGVGERFPEDLQGRDPELASRSYGERVAELVHCVRNTQGAEAFEPERAWIGALPEPPEMWSLGGGRAGALAAKHGICFGYNFMYRSSFDDPGAIASYRSAFAAHVTQPHARCVLAVAAICGDTDDQARQVASTYENHLVLPRVVGAPATCARTLRELHDRYGADELIIAEMSPELALRQRAIELLASVLDLNADEA